MQFLGTRLTDNIARSPEGFLICRNARLARTATHEPQLYSAAELGIGNSLDTTVRVWRRPEEVFARQFLASLEGKPVTNDHPGRFLDVTNASGRQCGHVQNIRTIPVNGDEGYVIGDLVVTEQILADEVERGKRELSVGYSCEYRELANGDLEQTNLLANHVAVVREGRAGSNVRIQDAKGTTMTTLEKLLAWSRLPESRRKAQDAVVLLRTLADELRGKRQDKRTLAEQMLEEADDVQELMRRNASAGEYHDYFNQNLRRTMDATKLSEDYAAAINARGRELRGDAARDCRTNVRSLRSTCDTRATDDEDWGRQMNTAGAKMRG
jgi:hypothetical protein